MNHVVQQQKVLRAIEEEAHKQNYLIGVQNAINENIEDVLFPFLNKEVFKSSNRPFEFPIRKRLYNTIVEYIKNLGLYIKPLNRGNNNDRGFISVAYPYAISKNNIRLYIKLCFSGGALEEKTQYCEYVEKSIKIADVKEGVLESVKDFKEDYYDVELEKENAYIAFNKKAEYEEQLNKCSFKH